MPPTSRQTGNSFVSDGRSEDDLYEKDTHLMKIFRLTFYERVAIEGLCLGVNELAIVSYRENKESQKRKHQSFLLSIDLIFY